MTDFLDRILPHPSEEPAGYFQLSRTLWYSLLFILPLVALYELLALAINWHAASELRNGADVFLRLLLQLFGMGTPYIIAVLVLLLVSATWFWQIRVHETARIQTNYMIWMLGESVVWAFVLLVLLLAADELLMLNTSDMVLQAAFLSVGAGIYEEAVFRLFLVGVLALFFRRALLWHAAPAWGVAVSISALLFAMFHFLGTDGDAFNWNSLAYRGVAGVLLGGLYTFRGFGITVYAHTAYDLLVLTVRTIT